MIAWDSIGAQWRNTAVCVVGLGVSGLATARWLAAHGARVCVADEAPQAQPRAALAQSLPEVELREGPLSTATFAGCQTLVLSPGVPRMLPAIATFQGEVIGDIEILARELPALPSKCLAITGSNGKTTVTALIGHLCQFAGLNTVIAGNIGIPVLEVLTQIEASRVVPDVFVLELSSFQLESTTSLDADAATVLNISEDHLDRYTDLLDYAHTKTRIFQGRGLQVLNRDDVFCRAMARAGRKQVWFSTARDAEYALVVQAGQHWLACDGQPQLACAELQLTGLHNAANALAALALTEAIGLPRATLLLGLCTFAGLPHRVESVLSIHDVEFIDDSKGTNVGATEAALNGMTRRVVLIAGGEGKGQDFSPLIPAVVRIGRAVILIGRDAPRLRQALAGIDIPLHECASLPEATRAAYAAAQPGDVVLLSPACASLDMFRDYAHRAEVFIATARELAAEAHA